MTYQIEITRNGQKKIAKDAITSRPLNFETETEAQQTADSMFALARCDYRNQGRRLPKYQVVAFIR